MNKLLVIGSNGMLGQRLVHIAQKRGFETLGASQEESSCVENLKYSTLELTEKDDIRKLIKESCPDYVANVAAFTNVDLCETKRELCRKVNSLSVEAMMGSCRRAGAHLLQISTDYVFDGTKGPYDERDLPCPLGYYGKTKLESENILRAYELSTLIRTNVLYGPAKFGRPDFVKWVVSSLKEGREINIVTDQINNPTYLDDLSGAILDCFSKGKTGTYHIGGPECLSRYDFTLRIARFFHLDESRIKPIKTEDLHQAARRPLKSGLLTSKAESEFNYRPTSYEKSFAQMQEELGL